MIQYCRIMGVAPPGAPPVLAAPHAGGTTTWIQVETILNGMWNNWEDFVYNCDMIFHMDLVPGEPRRLRPKWQHEHHEHHDNDLVAFEATNIARDDDFQCRSIEISSVLIIQVICDRLLFWLPLI
jgi:hypothetical protein